MGRVCEGCIKALLRLYQGSIKAHTPLGGAEGAQGSLGRRGNLYEGSVKALLRLSECSVKALLMHC